MLYQIRNPWGIESQSDGTYYFSGQYNDKAAVWTTDTGLVEQTGFVKANDGLMWVTGAEMDATFYALQIAEYREGWVRNWYSAESVSTTTQTYTFTLKTATKLYIELDFYNPRMYAPSCRADSDMSYATLALKQGTTTLQSLYQYDYISWSTIAYTSGTGLAAGTYTLTVTPKWTAADTKDYSVMIYAEREVVITDSAGKTNMVGAANHDTSL